MFMYGEFKCELSEPREVRPAAAAEAAAASSYNFMLLEAAEVTIGMGPDGGDTEADSLSFWCWPLLEAEAEVVVESSIRY